MKNCNLKIMDKIYHNEKMFLSYYSSLRHLKMIIQRFTTFTFTCFKSQTHKSLIDTKSLLFVQLNLYPTLKLKDQLNAFSKFIFLFEHSKSCSCNRNNPKTNLRAIICTALSLLSNVYSFYIVAIRIQQTLLLKY